MPKQYLVEGVEGAVPFVVDRTRKPVTESRPSGGKLWRLPGRLSVCDSINGNNRKYSRRVWENNLKEGSLLKESIKRNAAFGLLEHPDDGKVNLLSPISHHVTDAKLTETTDEQGNKVWEVHGEITIYDTLEGKKLQALIDGGYNPLVSSRGYGSLVTDSDGVDIVQDDYVCESWDVVIRPSFASAEMQADSVRGGGRPEESDQSDKRDEKTIVETQTPAAKVEPADKPLKESTPSKPGAAAPAASHTKPTVSTMQINEIKSRLAALKGVKPSELTAQRFAESMAEVESLHQATAQMVKEDVTTSYEATRISGQLDTIAENLQKAAAAPAQQAKKLQENNQQLMKVVAATAKTGITYKTKLSEATKELGSSKKLNEELTRKGKAWYQIAEDRKQKLHKVAEDFDVACEALDIITDRYHADTTELALAVVEMQFRDKLTPELREELRTATRMKHVLAVREKLEGKSPAPKATTESKAAKKTSPAVTSILGEKAADKKVDDKQVDESKKIDGKIDESKKNSDPKGQKTDESKKDDQKPGTQKATIGETKVTLKHSVRDPRNIQESIGLARRLSGKEAAPAK